MKQDTLHPCPYSLAVKCTLIDPCKGCETFAKYLIGEEVPRFSLEQSETVHEPQSIEGVLWDAMDKGLLNEIQYTDYEDNQWTVPVLLNENRIQRILTDNSITKIRFSFILKL